MSSGGDDKRIDKRLRTIVQALLPKGAPADKVDKCLLYAKKIVGSSIGRGGLGDPANAITTDRVVGTIKKALVVSNRGDSTKPLRFSELAGEYLQKRSLKHPRQPLVLLYALRGSRVCAGSSNSSINDDYVLLDGGLRQPTDVMRVIPPRQHEILGLKRKAEHGKEEEDDAEESSEQRKREAKAAEKSRKREMAMKSLLRDVVASLQGVDTDRVRFMDGGFGAGAGAADSIGNVVISADPLIEPKTAALARDIAEGGLLFRRVARIADTLSASGGSALLGLSAALRDELDSLRRLYAVIDAQQNTEDGLTLHRVLVWVQEPLRKLRVLLDVAEEVSSPSLSVAVGTVLHCYPGRGDPLADTLISALARKVARPLHRAMVEWILNGTLGSSSDPDFFVRTFEGEFYIEKKLVPAYISPALARDVLLAGKTAHLIRNVCGESGWSLGPRITTRLRKVGTEYDSIGLFADAVAAAAHSAGRHLMAIMNNTFHVMDHARGIRQYVLLGQGDFAQNLVDSLAGDLSRPAAMLFRHNLVPFLDAAIRASNARYSPQYVLDSLDISLQESSPERPGWEKFALTYVVSGPIALVFTPIAMRGYSELFAATWRIKRAEYVLENAWRLQSGTARALRVLTKAFPIALSMDILRSEMAHFLASFKQFINADVVEPCWEKFVAAAEANKDSFDDLVSAHSTFLNDVLRMCLIAPESLKVIESGMLVKKSNLHRTFDGILKLILEFCVFQESFYTSAFQEV